MNIDEFTDVGLNAKAQFVTGAKTLGERPTVSGEV